jgi:hypothetical protein
VKRHLRPVHNGQRFQMVGPSLSLTQDEVAEIVRTMSKGAWWRRVWGGPRAGRVAVIVGKLQHMLDGTEPGNG